MDRFKNTSDARAAGDRDAGERGKEPRVKRKRREKQREERKGQRERKREEKNPGENERNWLKGKRMHGRTTSGAKRVEERDGDTREEGE